MPDAFYKRKRLNILSFLTGVFVQQVFSLKERFVRKLVKFSYGFKYL